MPSYANSRLRLRLQVKRPSISPDPRHQIDLDQKIIIQQNDRTFIKLIEEVKFIRPQTAESMAWGAESERAVPRLTERRKAAVDAAMRDGLFEAAVAVIAQHGSAGLTMERLAIAARVAKGSVYNYFRNKRGLLQFVYQKAYEPINVQMHEIAASAQAAHAKLEAMARMYFEHVNQDRELFAFLLNDASVRGLLKTEQDSLRAQVIVVLTGIIEQGIAAGEFKPLDAKRVAEMVLGAIRQLAECELAGSEPRTAEDIVRVLVPVFLEGISQCRRVTP